MLSVNFFFMLHVVMLSVFILSDFMLYVFMLNVLMLCVIMLNVVMPLRQTLLLMTFAQRCVFTKKHFLLNNFFKWDLQKILRPIILEFF